MSRYDDLERLAKLHNEGVLTEDEFLREKARLLAQGDDATAVPSPKTGIPVVAVSTKSRLVSLLLCLFFGSFGLHRAYVKRTKSALLMAGLAFISFFSCIKSFKPIDLSSASGFDSGWEYFGELSLENGKIFTNTQNIKPLASVFFINMILQGWKLFDLIMILFGQFRDIRRRLVLRW
ncbi:MAG: NINE protein [Spirochaetia bacterium]